MSMTSSDALSAVKPLGYSTRYLEWCHKHWDGLLRGLATQASAMFAGAAALLEKAQIYQLPDLGRTVVGLELVPASWAPLLQLPHPITAFEFACPQEYLGDHAATSHQRIALCANIGEARAARITSGLDAPLYDGAWVQITLCTTREEKGGRLLWVVPPVLNIIHADFVGPLSKDLIDNALKNAKRRDSLGKKDPKENCETDMAQSLQEIGATGGRVLRPKRLVAGGPVQEKAALAETRDELLAAIEACVTLSCSNVKAVKIRPPADINRTRQARGVPPLRSVHVLTVDGELMEPPRLLGATAAARFFRRAQIVHQPNGETTWVRHELASAGTTPATGR